MILRKVREYLGNGRTTHYYEKCYTPHGSEGKRGEQEFSTFSCHCPSEPLYIGSMQREDIERLEREAKE